MKVLTKPSNDGHGYSIESGDLTNGIYKLGKIEHKAYDLISDACDNYCRHARSPITQEQLDGFCGGCPLTKMHDLIYKGEPK